MFKCTNHCSNCGQHFHSVAAFDLHRFRGECWDAATDERFIALSRAGQCLLARPRIRGKVTIWMRAKDAG